MKTKLTTALYLIVGLINFAPLIGWRYFCWWLPS